MRKDKPAEAQDPSPTELDPSGLELSDEDILDAMSSMSGYIDISTEDFREIFHLAHAHALARLFGRARATTLMRTGIEPLRETTKLDQAARSMATQGLKGLPVVDAEGRVVGMLTETDYLRRLGADTFLALLLRLIEDAGTFTHRCHESEVRAAMSAPAVTVREDAGLVEITEGFRAHPGRSMAVVDNAGRLRGLLMRKDFVEQFDLGSAP